MDNDNIPRLVWERDQARSSHTIKVLSRLVILLSVALVAVVIAFLVHLKHKDKEWLDFLSDYDIEGYSLSTEGGGDANYIGRDGAITYGEDKSAEDDPEEWQGEG